jgi:hypothetical protein
MIEWIPPSGLRQRPARSQVLRKIPLIFLGFSLRLGSGALRTRPQRYKLRQTESTRARIVCDILRLLFVSCFHTFDGV